MFNSKLVKNILSLLVIVGVVYLSYRYVTRPLVATDTTPSIAVSSTDATTVASTENLANVFAGLLEKLSSVDFQQGSSIFNNPVFQNGLVSFSRSLPNIDQTRNNPFAPVEGNPALYISYPTPPLVPLTFSTSTTVLPVGTTTATTTKK
jgi:hypothetical protein